MPGKRRSLLQKGGDYLPRQSLRCILLLLVALGPTAAFVYRASPAERGYLSIPSCDKYQRPCKYEQNFSLQSTNEKTKEAESSTLRPNSMAAVTKAQGKVPYGESSRQYRRTVYSSYENWVEHRSQFGIFENLTGMFLSGIIRQLKNEVLTVTAVALILVIWNGFYGNEGALPHLSLPSVPFTLSSPALGLLLVFRTNTSYGRWLEARMKWATIQTHSFNIVRMAATFVDTTTSAGKESLDRLVKATWALSRCLMNKFSDREDEAAFEKELQRVLGEDNPYASQLLIAPDRPTEALLELSFALDNLPIDEKRRLEIDKSIIFLGDCVTSCERIFTSPVPLVYTRHTARFLSL